MGERVKIEYNGFLFLVIPLILIITKITPKLSALISTRFFTFTPKEREQIAQVMQLKKEMAATPMVDEFAKYAKLQRKLNQLTLDLGASGDCRKAMQLKIYRWVRGVLSMVVGLLYLSMLWNFGVSTPVFVVPKHWFFPLQKILAYPTGIEGAISIPIWTLLLRNVVSVVASNIKV